MRLTLVLPLLIGAALTSGPGLCAQEHPLDEEQAIAQIKRLKGQVKRDLNNPDKPAVSLDLHGTRISDADLEILRSLTKLQSLNLYNTNVTDAGLVHLQGLTSLSTLYLNYTSITDAGLAHLTGLPHLQQLGLYHTQVTD